MASQDNIDSRQTVTNGGFILNVVNKPLPWLIVLALVLVFLSAQAYMAKEAAFNAQTVALLADQHFKDYTQRTDDYIEKLRIELASHGIKPPPKEYNYVLCNYCSSPSECY